METLLVIFKIFALIAGILILAIVIFSIIKTLVEEVMSKRKNKGIKETLEKVLKDLEEELKSQIENDDKEEDKDVVINQTIRAGVPVFVDLQKINNYGNVYMHTEPSSFVTDDKNNSSEELNITRKAAYIWLDSNIDDRTKYLPFSVFN